MKSQLSFVFLFSFEMLSDCVISRLCMRILTLTWENLISVKFFSVFLVLQCGASRRSLLVSGRLGFSRSDVSLLESEPNWSLVIRTSRVVRPDARWLHCSDSFSISSGRALPVCFFPRQRASERYQSTVRKGIPEAIKSPDRQSHISIPHKIPSFDTLLVISWVFRVFSTCLLVHSHSIPGIFF